MKSILISSALLLAAVTAFSDDALYGSWWKSKDKIFQSAFEVSKEKKTVKLTFPIVNGNWDIIRVNFPRPQDWSGMAALEFDLKIESSTGKLPRRHLGIVLYNHNLESGEPYINASALDRKQCVRIDLLKFKKNVLENVTTAGFFIWHLDFIKAGFTPGRDSVTFELSDFRLVPFDRVENKVRRNDARLKTGGNGTFWSRSATAKVMQDDRVPEISADAVHISAAGNEYEPFQIVYTPDGRHAEPGKLTYAVSNLRGPDGAVLSSRDISVRNIGYVNVTEKNTAGELSKNLQGKFVSRPGLWPDPLFNENSQTVDAGRNYPAWFTVFVPSGTRPGIYKGTITASISGKAGAEFPLELEVYPFELPKTPSLRTLAQFTTGYGFGKHYSDVNDFRLHEAHYRSLAAHRLSPMHLPPKGPPRPFDASKYDRYLDLAKELNFTSWLKFYWAPPVRTPEDRAWVKQVLDHQEKRGVLSKTYTYVCDLDEVGDAKYPDIIKAFDAIHGTDPRFDKVFLTMRSSPYLFGVLDVWVPSYANDDQDFCETRDMIKKHNPKSEVWLYGGPSYLLALPAISPRIIPWFDWKYAVDGRLFWCVNAWDGNLWEGEAQGASSGNRAGEGMLIYPPLKKDAPGIIDSVRYEMLREGMEDYEYLKLWEARVNALFQKISESKDVKKRFVLGNLYKRTEELGRRIRRKMIPSFQTYDTDPADLYEIRAQLAGQIAEIDRALNNQ